jgi:ribosomal RNA assembly protein
LEQFSIHVKIPRERIGALIGPNGQIKRIIEKKLLVDLRIDSETGSIEIKLSQDNSDPSLVFRAKEVVTAIGRGFSFDRITLLLDDDEAVFWIIDLREIVGRSLSDMKRLKGRVIGKNGKTRQMIEELTDSRISIYGHTISIIGDMEQSETAREAIRLLLKGKQHRSVYRFLHKKRRDQKKKKIELWETRAYEKTR